MAAGAGTPEPLEPVKNACERGKGRVLEERELVTSPYIIPQPRCYQFVLRAGSALRFMAGVLCSVQSFGWGKRGGVGWDPGRLAGISGSGLQGWSLCCRSSYCTGQVIFYGSNISVSLLLSPN